MKKLMQQKGETLIEAMVSLLIALLSMSLLCTAALAAAKINRHNKEADRIFEKDLMRAEKRLSEEDYLVETDCSLLIEYETLENQTIYVNVYGGAEGTLISYEAVEVSVP